MRVKEETAGNHAPGVNGSAAPSPRRPLVVEWAHRNIDLALRLCYVAAFLAFAIPVALIRNPILLGVFIGFILLRIVLGVAEWLGGSVFTDNIIDGRFHEAIRAPGLNQGRQAQVLRRMVGDQEQPGLAEHTASYVAFALDMGRNDLVSVLRTFEDHWGKPPVSGSDESVFRRLLNRGFHFTVAEPVAHDTPVVRVDEISWRRLWRERLWDQLRIEHPGESLPRLLLRLFATEWQAILAPLWVLVTAALLALVGGPWLKDSTRGVVFYSMFLVLGPIAAWLAFVLRPSAFNASLMAGDMDRCAHWVLESTEGKHFLVSALSSKHRNLRFQAVRLLVWNDILLQANITLPEGMRGFARREGTRPHA